MYIKDFRWIMLAAALLLTASCDDSDSGNADRETRKQACDEAFSACMAKCDAQQEKAAAEHNVCLAGCESDLQKALADCKTTIPIDQIDDRLACIDKAYDTNIACIDGCYKGLIDSIDKAWECRKACINEKYACYNR